MDGIFQSRWHLWLFVALAVGFGGEVHAESEAADGNAWEWSLTPYLWFSDTSYELRAGGQNIGSGDIDFGELADTIDGAFQIVAEAGRRGGRWSGFVDLTYLSTSDDRLVDVPGLGTLEVATKSDQMFIDAAVAFWPWREVSGFNVYAGLRYTDLDDQTKIDLIDPGVRLGVIDVDRRFTDVLIGMRDRFRIAEHWALIIRADYGFGDSDGVLMAQAAVRWAVGSRRRHGIVAGYRYKEAEFEDDGLKEKYEYKGPVVGFNFRF